jgi:OmpA-OmpF porin, OOP family
MTHYNGISERNMRALFVTALFFTLTMYTCLSSQAQTANADNPEEHYRNGKFIHVAAHINPDALAQQMNATINSPYVELKPVFAPDGNRLYFSRSFHPGNTSGESDQEDIWYSNLDTTGSIWSTPVRMSSNLNNAGPNFIETISMTGDTIILGNQYLKRGKMRNGVSYSVYANGEWSLPQDIKIKNNYNISNQENHNVNLKNGVIVLAVERLESFGARDLYVSFWNGYAATEPVNMGGIVNTEFEESAPFMSADGKTLYFASRGHSGFGGLDIFMSTRLDDSWTNWTVPQNLGSAVNGPMDESFFNITHCGKFALFSKQVNIHNVDIFSVSTEDLFQKPTLSNLAMATSVQ